ncbi:hypothetical protein [Sporolactobacillus spathodeae]|uniref:DUF1453 domain-containing protein n=1 Tax=Sporolactobacillus spathodeae TaxID=1465502 RepID=A0ABS2Q549_9BACL|nr:hypothetical protein [Sporolactobacillus spathodeae]MBM7656890.1 hypothetical protein [Sporolactobacillus spathodeae]
MNEILIALVLLLLLIRHQLKSRLLKRSLFTLPLLLLIYSIYLSVNAGVSLPESFSLVISTVLGGLIGLIQGKYASVYETDGFWWVRGSWLTLTVWLLSIPVRYLVKYGYLEAFHVHTVLIGSQAYIPILFSLAGILFGKVIMLTWRFPEQMRAAANDQYRGARRAARRSHRQNKRK